MLRFSNLPDFTGQQQFRIAILNPAKRDKMIKSIAVQ